MERPQGNARELTNPNGEFIGKGGLGVPEQAYNLSDSTQYWSTMARLVPNFEPIFAINKQRLGEYFTGAEDADYLRTCDDGFVMYRVQQLFERLGPYNGLRDNATRQKLIRASARFLEAHERDLAPHQRRDNGTLEQYMVEKLMDKDMDINMYGIHRSLFADMLNTVAGSFNNDKKIKDSRTRGQRDLYESMAQKVYNHRDKQDKEDFVPEVMSWLLSRDIEYARIARIEDKHDRHKLMREYLTADTEWLGDIIDSNVDQRYLYSYYLPLLIRVAAWHKQAEAEVVVRRSIIREERPHNGLHGDLIKQGIADGFHFKLSYPTAARTIFLRYHIGDARPIQTLPGLKMFIPDRSKPVLDTMRHSIADMAMLLRGREPGNTLLRELGQAETFMPPR